MSTSQTIRYATPNLDDPINPTHIVADLVRITDQLFGAGSPAANLGVIGNVYTDVTTGFQYQKHGDGWDATIALGSFAVIPDPLSVNELDVNIIKGRSTKNVQIDLGTAPAGMLSIGPTAALSRVQIGSDGTILTDSLTSSVIVADSLGNQTDYAPQQMVGTNNISVVANNVLSLITNVSNIAINAATDVDISAVGDCTFTVGGNPVLVVQPTDLALTGDILPTSSSTYVLGRNTNTFAETHSDGVFVANGSAAGPSYSFDASHNDGIYSAVAGNVSTAVGGVQMLNVSSGGLFVGSSQIQAQAGAIGIPSYAFNSDTTTGAWSSAPGTYNISAGGVNKLAIAANISNNASIVPLVNNSYDLGTALLDFRDIYLQNVPTIISDARKKTNVDNLDAGLELVESLRPVSFQFKDSEDIRYKIGFIAQEVSECVSKYSKDYDVVNHDEINDIYAMKYESLIGVLVKSVQELSAKVKDLEAKHN